jgi:F0F1-type ATP synthase delta subunit
VSRISRTTLAKLLAERFAETKDPAKLEQEVAAYLLSERRVGELDSLMRDIAQLRADAGYVEADTVSAFPLTPAAEADVKAALKSAYPHAKSIRLYERRDERVIGGVKLELANQQMDISIRAKLNRFKQLVTTGKEN